MPEKAISVSSKEQHRIIIVCIFMGKTQIETKQMIEETYITLKYFRSQDFVMKFAIVHSGQTVNVRYYSGKLRSTML